MINIYCERLDSGLLAEPINTFSNIGFLIAAYASWCLLKELTVGALEIRILINLIVAIGIGSTLFHTFSTIWAQILDFLPIILFQITYLWVYAHKIIKIRPLYIIGMVFLFLMTLYFGRQFPHLLNGSLIYTPTLILLGSLGIYHYRHVKNQPYLLLWATALFIVAVFFRSIDQAVCTTIPIGSHFLWHLLNGLIMYLITKSLLLNIALTQKV